MCKKNYVFLILHLIFSNGLRSLANARVPQWYRMVDARIALKPAFLYYFNVRAWSSTFSIILIGAVMMVFYGPPFDALHHTKAILSNFAAQCHFKLCSSTFDKFQQRNLHNYDPLMNVTTTSCMQFRVDERTNSLNTMSKNLSLVLFLVVLLYGQNMLFELIIW